MDLSTFAFVTLGLLAIIFSGMLITRRFPVSAAMLLIVVFTLLAGMYGLMDAHFAAIAQLIVYAGAIMVVFVFVMMLLNLPPEELRYGGVTFGEGILALAGVSAAIALGTKIGRGALGSSESLWGSATPLASGLRPGYFPEGENVKNVAALMFTDYLWAFELISILIMAATVGSVVIAKKRSGDAKHS